MKHFTVLLYLGTLLCLLRYAKCEHDTTTTIEVGGSGSSCSSLANTTNIVHTEWSIYIDWAGDYFTSPCEFKFYAKESDENDDNEENYKVCVKRITYDVSDCNVWLEYEEYGEKSSDEKYTCYSTVEEIYCADEGKDYVNITFSSSYSISSFLPSSFQNSAIRLQVYAKYEFPVWLIIVIVVVSIVFVLAVSGIITICCIKHHKKRSQGKVFAQNSQTTTGGTQQTINQRPGYNNTTTMSQTSHQNNMNTAGFAHSTHQYNTQYNTEYSNMNVTGFGNPTMPMPMQNRTPYPVRLEPIQNAKQYNYTDEQLYGHQQNHPPPPPPVFSASGTSAGQPEYLPPPPSAPQSLPSEPPPAYGQITSTL